MCNKKKQIKIYAIESKDFKELARSIDRYEVDTTREIKKVDMGDTFFIKAFMTYKNMKSAQFIDGIIKVFLPVKNEGEIARSMLNRGIYINDVKYVAYTSTPSLQKKETQAEKCEFIFIKKSDEDFITWFQSLISLGKFREKFIENKEEIEINKKITSRTALAFSSVTKINCFQPRIIVVKNHKWTDYNCMVDMIETEGVGKERKVVLENGKPKLKLNTPFDIEHEANDGMGLMSPQAAQVIQQSMNLNYDVYFAVIRMFNGLAVKGMCMTFDMVSYFEEYNKGCIGTYGCYTVVDAWGKERDIRECDLLLTESQTKWKANWSDEENIDEIKNRIKECKSFEQDLINTLYVTKVNKNPDKLPTHTYSNYQLIGNLNISINDYKKLAEETYNLYKGVLDGRMDCIKLFLKDFIEDPIDEIDDINEEDEILNENETLDEEEIKEILPSTVSEKLLNISHDFYKLRSVKRALFRLVEKKIYNLMSGRVYIRGGYTYVAQDPIFMLNKLIGIKSEGELQANEFYCAGENKEYVIQRCPCNCYNEIVKCTVSSNKVYDKYLIHIKQEMMILNAKDSTNTRMSTMDFDGDGVIKTDEPIILNSVIPSDTFFVNQEDGYTEKMVYNSANRKRALYETSGNIIGQLALLGGTISNRTTGDFEEYIHYLYLTLLMEQIAIDCPKTMVQVPESMFNVLGEVKDWDKPYYMIYRNKVKNSPIYDKSKYIKHDKVRSTLDRYAKYCMDTILAKYYDKQKENKDAAHSIETVFRHMVLPLVENEDVEKYRGCKEEIYEIWTIKEQDEEEISKWYKEHEKISELSNEIERIKFLIKKCNEKIKSNKEIIKEERYSDEHTAKYLSLEIYEEEEYLKELIKGLKNLKKELKPFREERKIKQEASSINLRLMAIDVENKYEYPYILNALYTGRLDEKKHQYTIPFVFKNFFDLITKYMPTKNCYCLEEVDAEEYDFECMGKKYKRVEAKIGDTSIVIDQLISTVKRVKKTEKLGITVERVGLGLWTNYFEKPVYLEGKTLRVSMDNPKGNSPVLLDENGEIIGHIYKTIIDDVHLSTVDEIEILKAEVLKGGKSLYLKFKM